MFGHDYLYVPSVEFVCLAFTRVPGELPCAIQVFVGVFM